MNPTDCIRLGLKYFQSQGVLKSYTFSREDGKDLYEDFIVAENDRLPKNFRKYNTFLFQLQKKGFTKSDNKTKDNLVLHLDKHRVDSILSNIDYVPPEPRSLVVVSQNYTFRRNRKQTVFVNQAECKLCDIKFSTKDAFDAHCKTLTHDLCYKYRNSKNSFLENSDVYMEFEEGFGNSIEKKQLRPGEEHILSFKLYNSSKTIYNIKNFVELNSKLTEMRLETLPEILKAKSCVELKIKAYFTTIKFDKFILVVILEDPQTMKVYTILKELQVTVMSDFMDDLRAIEPYRKPSKNYIKEHDDEIVRGERIKRKSFKPKLTLQPYIIPKNYIILLNSGLKPVANMSPALETTLKNLLALLKAEKPKQCLTSKNYYELLNFLLYAEEHQMSKDIRDYDMTTTELVQMPGQRNRFRLPVPGLAEHRPSLIVGDCVNVKQEHSKIKFEGVVQSVQENAVILGFDSRFANTVYQKNMKLLVSFNYNRFTLKVEHQALQLLNNHNGSSHVFPKNYGNNPLKTFQLKWFNNNIGSNTEQQQAIKHIMSKTSYPAPYLIFGPPGTGKTSTIVEAILQLWNLKKGIHILVCAPSNNAANEVARRLTIIPKRDMLRYVAAYYPAHDLPVSIKPYANFHNLEHFHPAIKELEQYQVVITTIVNASRLVNMGVPVNHFEYVFIDESGNCTETETLVPISGILTGSQNIGTLMGQVVLAGDPKQLGPIIHSPLAKEYGFDISLLERFMNTIPLYQKDSSGKYDSNLLTKLVNNYRSHPDIIEIPNKLFYDNELKAKGDALINTAVGWDSLKNKKKPVLFHHVVGKDERESRSPSWFNLSEIEIVVRYLKELIGSRLNGMKINEEHIGIISPYKQQVNKLKTVCRKFNWNNIAVGSVEQFQGQEKLIIIITTVRSNSEFVKFDHKFHLGFLKNPKRFNVALTRAKALLIVVGNASLLQNDPNWFEFINYCSINKCTTGSSFDLIEKPDPIEELAIEISNLNIQDGAKEDNTDFSRGNV